MRSNSLFLGVLCLCVTSSSSDPLRPSAQAHGYLHFADIEHHCQSVLTSAATLTRHAYRATSLKRELSFHKGDWRQDAGGDAPLVPFDGSDVSSDARRRPPLDPLSLATLVVTHVDDERRARTAVNVSGVLVLSIARKNRDSDIGVDEPAGSPEFELSPGRTRLKITFEGVYTERGDGERVLCMVGSALLPTRSPGGGVDPWDWATNYGRSSVLPPVAADDNILLVLRYPKELTLTTRAVLGEMRSTSTESAVTYFDPVKLVSQLHDTPYQFGSPALVADDACDSLPSSVVGGNRAGHLNHGGSLCDALQRYSYGRGRVLTALPNWHGCNSTATPGASCRSLGPFEMEREADVNEPAGVGIMIQDLRCHADIMSGTVRVSAVFRAVPPSEEPYTAARRSGLGGTTLSAEGVCNASAGQACMVACRGTGNETCPFRVSFYMPTTFSITDRSILVGRITRINAPPGGAAHSTSLSFQLGLSLPQYWGWDSERPAFRYNYTKVNQAGELLRLSDTPFSLRRIITSLLALSYPKREDMMSLGHLIDYLDLHFTAVPGIFAPERIESPVLHLKIIFVGQVSDRHSSRANGFSMPSGVAGERRASETIELPINVSAELTVFGDPWVATSVMSLEGLYNPQDGRMYLVGCRDVGGGGLPWRNSSTSGGGLEDSMDCSIEVEVEYPPTTTHRFMSSTAKVRIASTRNAGDPLHFGTMKMEATPIRYPKPQPDDPNRGIANGVLGLTVLSASIAASLSQLRHLKTHSDAAPYVSLVMLVEQAIGLGLPLTTGVEALLARGTLFSDIATPSSFPRPSYSLIDNRLYQSIHFLARIVSLGAFIITRQLFQEVRRSRALLQAPPSPALEPRRVPGDAEVLAYFAAAHLFLAMLVLALNGRNISVEQHVGLTQDLFLVPQVIGNAVWRVNCRPLARSYYLGVTATRLLPHLYDYVRPPPGARVYDTRVFSHAGDAVIPAVSVLLALIVHVQQQRWNYAIVNWMGLAEQRKRQHVF